MESNLSSEVIYMIFNNPLKLKVYIHDSEIDMRKSWEGLISMVRYSMNLNPFDASLFVFYGKSRKLVKILYWDGNGFCIWMKKLYKGNFPFGKSGKTQMSHRDLKWLLSGIDTRKQHEVIKQTYITEE
jgi:transposase